MKTAIIISFCLFAISCSKSGPGDSGVDCSTSKSFATDVNPVIQSSCATNAGCHASGSFNGPGALTTYKQVYDARLAIRASVADGSMPQNSKLTTFQKNSILCWIDNGATNN